MPPCDHRLPPPARSVAVLTFENTARDTSAQYLAEGLADQITTRLGSVARLATISRTAVRRLRSPEQLSVQQLGRALNAAYLVNGSLRAAGGRVRVNVETLRAATGELIWSAAYDRASDDLIGIEEAIATEVASGVAGRLSPQERRALGSRVTSSSSAYEQFLRGNVLLARRTAASLEGAVASYRAAAVADSGFADAYGRLAYAYVMCANWGVGGDVDSLLALARGAAARALRLDARSSDAWMALGWRLFLSSALWRVGSDDSLLASLAAFRRSVELNPRNDEAWHQYGATLAWVDDSASLAVLRRALALDRTRAVTYADLAATYYRMGTYDRALQTIDSAVALEPDGPFRMNRALYRVQAGDTAGAVADARLSPSNFWGTPAVLAAFAHDSASLRVMESEVARPPSCEPGWAEYLVWTGRRELAVQRLLPCGPSLRTRWQLRSPALAPLADDRRIQALRAQSDSILARARWR
jgi:TolB-like protein